MNSYVVPAQERYQSHDYSYGSGNSRVSINHFRELAADVLHRVKLEEEDLVIDIGSNDGTLLSFFKAEGCEVLGIEPSPNMAEISRTNDINVVNDFFRGSITDSVLQSKSVKAVTCTNCFNHIADPSEFFMNLQAILTQGGKCVIEVPYSSRLIRECQFDTIYLEHISYFSVTPLVSFAKRFGLDVVRVEEVEYMGGSIRVYFAAAERDETVERYLELEKSQGLFEDEIYKKFALRAQQCKVDLVSQLGELKEQGRRIAAIGAATKGNTLLNYCGIDNSILDFVTDASPLKIGKYTPGSRIPIVSDDRLDASITHVLILAWNIADYLIDKISKARPDLKFIVPRVKENY